MLSLLFKRCHLSQNERKSRHAGQQLLTKQARGAANTQMWRKITAFSASETLVFEWWQETYSDKGCSLNFTQKPCCGMKIPATVPPPYCKARHRTCQVETERVNVSQASRTIWCVRETAAGGKQEDGFIGPARKRYKGERASALNQVTFTTWVRGPVIQRCCVMNQLSIDAPFSC